VQERDFRWLAMATLEKVGIARTGIEESVQI
jgi:hypothetical protein